MNSAEPGFLALLEQAANAAQREEISFRERIAAEVALRERERQFAFRRLGIAKVMARAAAASPDAEAAVAAQAAAFRRELGWHGDSDQRKRALNAWAAVSEAVWREVGPRPAQGEAEAELPSVGDAMAAFEGWYIAQFGTSYLALLDQDIPEMPVVEI